MRVLHDLQKLLKIPMGMNAIEDQFGRYRIHWKSAATNGGHLPRRHVLKLTAPEMKKSL